MVACIGHDGGLRRLLSVNQVLSIARCPRAQGGTAWSAGLSGVRVPSGSRLGQVEFGATELVAQECTVLLEAT